MGKFFPKKYDFLLLVLFIKRFVMDMNLFNFSYIVMFKKVYFAKIGPNFVGSTQFHLKIYQRNTSLLGKSLLDFVSLRVKLHNRYCHIVRQKRD